MIKLNYSSLLVLTKEMNYARTMSIIKSLSINILRTNVILIIVDKSKKNIILRFYILVSIRLFQTKLLIKIAGLNKFFIK